MSFNIETCTIASDPDVYGDWFEQWKKYLPWKTNKKLVLERLDRLSREYRTKYDPRDVTLDEESSLFRRLLYSLTFHWTRTPNAPPIDDDATIASLEKTGRGGSNPLDDLTLVDSLMTEIRENRTQAKEYLEKTFGAFAVKTARRLGLPVSSKLSDCEWWLNAYYSMVGLSGRKPALGTYAGRAGLGSWVKKVVYSANRPSAAPEALPVDAEDDEKLQDLMANIVQGGRLSASAEAEIAEFRDALREFWLASSPLERAILLYWNEKTPRRLARAKDYADVWELPVDDVREAYKVCGVGLRGKAFTLALVERRKAFLRKFSFEPSDAPTFVPLYWSRLMELDREFPVGEKEIVDDVCRRFGKEQ